MSKFIISGGQRLRGQVRIQGSKNAAFPLMAATILARSVCVIDNIPDISDVHVFLRALAYMGAQVRFQNHRLWIDTSRMRNRKLPSEFAGKLRGSLVFAGALLARFGSATLSQPGGDAIGARPIDVHLDGFKKLGAAVHKGRDSLRVTAKRLTGARIVLAVTSVTGTENLILAAVLADGVTEIKLAATEPHVQELCRFLNRMGAKISGVGTPHLTIRGVKKLHGAKFRACADEIAVITYAVAAAATKGRVKITGVDLDHLDAPLSVLDRMGVNFRAKRGQIEILEPKSVYRGVRIITGVYPQLLTDMQPLLGVLATQARGASSIHDWIYEGRQGYLRALRKMGARVKFDDVHRSHLYGPVRLHGSRIPTPDIRAGASILIAALVARGRSVLYNAEIIDRGYEKIDEKLRQLGAHIERVE